MLGTADNQIIKGLAGDDTLTSRMASDTLIGGAGNDWLTGNGGKDVFEFAAGHGMDTITDFEDGEDLISLAGAADASDVKVANEGSDVTVTWSGGTIVLQATRIADITTKDLAGIGAGSVSLNLTGDGSRNSLDGGEGNDTLSGLAGDEHASRQCRKRCFGAAAATTTF